MCFGSRIKTFARNDSQLLCTKGPVTGNAFYYINNTEEKSVQRTKIKEKIYVKTVIGNIDKQNLTVIFN